LKILILLLGILNAKKVFLQGGSIMKKFFIIGIVSLFGIVSSYAFTATSQSFTFTYDFTIKYIPKDAKEIKFWVPYPPQDVNQKIVKVNIDMPGSYKIVKDDTFKNAMIFGTFKNGGASTVTGSITYHVERFERLHKPGKLSEAVSDAHPDELHIYKQPGKLVTISPRIKRMAQEITAGQDTPLQKARAIYDYVFENMEYNKGVPGWGKGDTERACDIRKGNCTDFHSLFISLARASNIPAKFVIGFNIPDQKQSVVGGYHCWAEFYINGLGWIPVDISEAWKNKSKRDYYFGNLDKGRIAFTVGRDIVLKPAQKGEPLNYFIYPYVEIDGRQAYGIETAFSSALL
jgi:transglutaminase-like putative cysteine protease